MREKLARHRWKLELALAVLLAWAGIRLPFSRSIWVAAIASPMILGGAVWGVRALLRPGPDGAPPSLGRKKAALAFSASVVALVLAFAVTSRVRARAVGFGSETLTRWASAHEEIGWVPREGTVGSRGEVPDPAREQILLIGDSIVYGHGVEASETVAAYLQRARPKDQIINAAVSGYSIDQYFLYLRHILPKTTPKLIVVGLFAGNDFQLTAREMTWGKGKPLYAVEDGKLVRVGAASECVDRLAGSLLFRALWREPKAANRLLVKMCDARSLRRGETEAVISKFFDELDALAATRNIPVLWVMLPVKFDHSVYEPDRYLHVGRYFDLMQILRQRPRQIYDFSLDIVPKQATEAESFFLSDNSHFTPKGHAVLADALAREIRARFPQLGDGALR